MAEEEEEADETAKLYETRHKLESVRLFGN
jgi:hypothetical protein